MVARGDPYPWQVAATTRAVVAALGRSGLDHVVCYQSRVGPLEWIGPSIEAELERAAADAVQVVVVPIAFVSEHSETLVELDVDYRARGRCAWHQGLCPGADRQLPSGVHRWPCCAGSIGTERFRRTSARQWRQTLSGGISPGVPVCHRRLLPQPLCEGRSSKATGQV